MTGLKKSRKIYIYFRESRVENKKLKYSDRVKTPHNTKTKNKVSTYDIMMILNKSKLGFSKTF